MATLTITGPRNVGLSDPGNLALLPVGSNVITLDPSSRSLVIIASEGNLSVGLNFQVTAVDSDVDQVEMTISFTLSTAAFDTTRAMRLGLTTHAAMEIGPPNFAVHELNGLTPRLMPSVVNDHPTPIIVHGRPMLPKYVGVCASSAPITMGSAHIRVIPNPNPVWNYATDGWFYPPPSSGVGDARWTVDDLPDPAGFPGAFYWLGDPSPFDGTSSIAGACRQWACNGGTPGKPSWRSVYPYKPSVRQHVNYGPGGKILTVTRGVRFNMQFVEHMWMAWPTTQGLPFTFVIVGIIMDFPTPTYEHTILDVGGNPQSFGAGVLNENQLGPDRALSDGTIDGIYRPQITVNQTEQHQRAEITGAGQIVSPFNFATRPKMWFGVWDGAGSRSGSMSTAGKYIVEGSQPATLSGHPIIGRRGGYLSRSLASHLVVFEIRFWNSALVEEQLDDQYNQLSATFDFASYS